MLIGIIAAVVIYWAIVCVLSRVTCKLEDAIERMHEYNALMDELDELDELDGEQKEEENV